jgi:hypothetical protein
MPTPDLELHLRESVEREDNWNILTAPLQLMLIPYYPIYLFYLPRVKKGQVMGMISLIFFGSGPKGELMCYKVSIMEDFLGGPKAKIF